MSRPFQLLLPHPQLFQVAPPVGRLQALRVKALQRLLRGLDLRDQHPALPLSANLHRSAVQREHSKPPCEPREPRRPDDPAPGLLTTAVYRERPGRAIDQREDLATAA